MKINQFAYKQESIEQITDELKQLGFLKENQSNSKALFKTFLLKSFPQYERVTSIEELFTRLLAKKNQTLTDFFSHNEPLTTQVFYCVALQLLGFERETFLAIEDFTKQAQTCGIVIENGDFTEKNTVLKAWYRLLCTRTAKGVTFLDDLAHRGFYKKGHFPCPFFINGKSQAVFDAKQAIYEVVYVESDLDTDEDGKRDLLKVEIIRPKETENGLKVPVLFTASPYDQGINHSKGNQKMHDVNVPLTRKTPRVWTKEEITFKEKKKVLPPKRKITQTARYATETFYEEKGYTLNHYLLSRGFASVYAAGIGTKDSDGIQTCGSSEQTEAMKNIVEWLAGNRRAFISRTETIEIKAWWCNQKVAMTGRSYLGTLATAVATTGVKGLETVISEAAISNWYQYYRDNGLVVAPGGFPGEDCDVLAEETFSRSLESGDYLKIKAFFDQKQEEMKQKQDRKTGDYSLFWDERNYLPHIHKIKCDMMLVHGVNDWNVKPRHVYQLWQELQKVEVTTKTILHQGEHIYINNMPSFDFHDVVNLWLSDKLYHQQNDANNVLPPIMFEDNLEKEKWQPLQTWENSKTKTVTYYLNDHTLSDESHSCSSYTYSDHLEKEQFLRYTKNINVWEKELKEEESPLKHHRYFVKSDPLKKELFITGAPKLTFSISSSQDIGLVSVQLVDFGLKKRLKKTPTLLSSKGLLLGHRFLSDGLKEFEYDKETNYKMITKGHLNLQNSKNKYTINDVKPNQPVFVSFDLQPTLYKLPKGHQIGLIMYGTDFGMTVRGNQNIEYTLCFEQATLTLPYQNEI